MTRYEENGKWFTASPEARALMRASSRRRWDNLSDEDAERWSGFGKKGMHTRWHTNRGVSNPDCAWCRMNAEERIQSQRSVS